MQSAFLRTFNGQLITLFWKIGEILHKHPQAALPRVAKRLSATWGRDFSGKNLDLVIKFYHSFPGLRAASDLSMHASWRQIAILLEQGKNEIPRIQGEEPIFKPSSLTPYWRLINSTPKKEIEPGDEVSALISRFIETQNRMFNAYLNKLFWEIGKIINENELSIRELASQLKPQKIFTAKNLTRFALFNSQVTDFHCAMRLSHLLPFNYIFALLPVQPLEAKLFYARIAAAEGLSLAALKKRIAAKEYQHTKGAKQREQQLIAQISNPVFETKITRSRNSKEIITHVYVNYGHDAGKSLLIKNISKNAYFAGFTK